MEDKYLVYKITNLINGKIYFGITKCSLQKRWNEHKHNSVRAKKQSHLNLAIKKYSPENFKIELIKECITEQEMYDLEIEMISNFKTTDRTIGYNNSVGGEASSKGKKLSEKTKEKISEYQKLREREPWDDGTKKVMREAALKNKSYLNLKKSYGHNKGKPAKNKRGVELLDNKGQSIMVFDSLQSAANHFKISIGTISNNLKGLSKTTKQGIWKYKE